MSTGGRLADSIQDMCFFIKEMLGTENKQGSKRASSGSARSCKASPKKKVKQRLDSRCQKASTRKLEVHVSASSSDPGVGVKKEPAKPAEPASSHRDGPRPLPTGQITKLYQQAASSASSFFHTDLSVPTVLRITGDSREAATMHNGPSAFAVAVWSDGHQIVSEIPNLMVDKAAAAKASARKHLQKQGDGEDSPTPAARADEDDAAAAEDDQAPAEAPLVPADAPAAAEDPNYGDLEVLPANASFRKEYRLANNSLAFRMIRIGETRTIESARGSCGKELGRRTTEQHVAGRALSSVVSLLASRVPMFFFREALPRRDHPWCWYRSIARTRTDALHVRFCLENARAPDLLEVLASTLRILSSSSQAFCVYLCCLICASSMAAPKFGAAAVVDVEQEEESEESQKVEDPNVDPSAAVASQLYYVHQKDWKYHARGSKREKSWMEDPDGFEQMISNMRWAFNKTAEDEAKEAKDAKEAKKAKEGKPKKKNKGIKRRQRGIDRGYAKGPGGTIRAESQLQFFSGVKPDIPRKPLPSVQNLSFNFFLEFYFGTPCSAKEGPKQPKVKPDIPRKPLPEKSPSKIPKAFQDKTRVKAEDVQRAVIPRYQPAPAININIFGSSSGQGGQAMQPPVGPGPIIRELEQEIRDVDKEDEEDPEEDKDDDMEGKDKKRKREEE
eukprot:s1093_g21.t1